MKATLTGIDRGDVLPLLARGLFEQAETAVGVTIVPTHWSMHLRTVIGRLGASA